MRRLVRSKQMTRNVNLIKIIRSVIEVKNQISADITIMVIVSTGKSVNLLTQLKSAKLEGSARRLIVKVDIQSHIDGFRKRLDLGEKNPVSSGKKVVML